MTILRHDAMTQSQCVVSVIVSSFHPSVITLSQILTDSDTHVTRCSRGSNTRTGDYIVGNDIVYSTNEIRKKSLECGPMPNVMAALCESSVIPFVVPRHTVWLTAAARVPGSNAANIGQRDLIFGCKVNIAAGKIPLGGNSRQKCIYSITVQATAKHRAKFG